VLHKIASTTSSVQIHTSEEIALFCCVEPIGTTLLSLDGSVVFSFSLEDPCEKRK
jgi:hypothetical protein